jgi:hypothetical protein
MFTYPRRWIATIGIALTFGLFSTSALPALPGGQSGSAAARTKSKAIKKTNRTRQS